MKRLALCIVVALFITACQKKEEPQPEYQFPSAPVQTFDETKLLREALQNDPENVNAWIKLGNILMDTSRFGEAIDAYQKALIIDQSNVNVRVDMGICFRNIGDSETAVKEFRKAIEINPDHLNAHKNLAIVLAYDLHKYEESIREFEKAISLAPSAPDVGRMKQEIARLKAIK